MIKLLYLRAATFRILSKNLWQSIFYGISQKQPPEVFCKKRYSYKFPTTLFKKETLVQVFSCEFWEISKNTFFTEHLRWLLLDVIRDHPQSSIIFTIQLKICGIFTMWWPIFSIFGKFYKICEHLLRLLRRFSIILFCVIFVLFIQSFTKKS